MTSPFWKAWFSPKISKRAMIVSAIVGTVLIAINQGDLILAGEIPPVWKIIMTYMVPYMVSSWSAASAAIASD